jgi:ABC-type transport system substrate-binding protein
VLFNSLTGPNARSLPIRRALAASVRARELVWRTLGSFAEPAQCLIPPGMLGHDPGRRGHLLTREETSDMLRSAGVEPPIRLSASVHPLFQDRYSALLKALASVWAELGVEVAIGTPGMTEYLESWQENKGYDLLIGRWNVDYDDPDNFTHHLFHSDAGLLRNYFASAESDQILEEARSESRPAARESLYRRFENLLIDGGILIPLFHEIDYRLAGPKVRDLTLRGSAPYVNYAELGKVASAETEAKPRWAGGGILQVPIAGVVTGLDPPLADTVEKAEVVPSLFECLTRDAGGARFVPWLASEMNVEEGGQRYRFRLRDDVRFHDGRRLSARDVRYSFERLLQRPDSETRWFFSSIQGARALIKGEARDLTGFRIYSSSEFTIELEEPVAFFPALIAYTVAAIIPEGSDPSGPTSGIVGTGPYQMVSFEPGVRLELKRNKNYWLSGYPQSEGLVFSFGVSPKDILEGFRAGRFSLASDLFPEDVEALRREPEFASSYRETPQLITYYAAFNAHRGPLADRALRQKLIHAVDVPRLVRQTLGRLAIPAHGLIPPGLLGHDPASGSRAEPAPSAKPGGAPTPIELTATVHPVFFGRCSALARELSSAFAERGVKIKPVNQTMTEYLDALAHGSADLVVGRWNADYPDADTFVHILHSRGLIGRFSSSGEIDRLVERGRAETAPAVRHSLYREIEETVAREALLLPLFHEQAYRFARPEVEGLTVSFASPAVAYESLHISRIELVAPGALSFRLLPAHDCRFGLRAVKNQDHKPRAKFRSASSTWTRLIQEVYSADP